MQESSRTMKTHHSDTHNLQVTSQSSKILRQLRRDFKFYFITIEKQFHFSIDIVTDDTIEPKYHYNKGDKTKTIKVFHFSFSFSFNTKNETGNFQLQEKLNDSD